MPVNEKFLEWAGSLSEEEKALMQADQKLYNLVKKAYMAGGTTTIIAAAKEAEALNEPIEVKAEGAK